MLLEAQSPSHLLSSQESVPAAAEDDFIPDTPNNAVINIQGFRGDVFQRNGPADAGKAYADKAYQYGSSSFAIEGKMQPRAIFCAKDDDDVKKVIKYARAAKIAVAVRTGGHQYCGASSTGGVNIQLDLQETYQSFVWEENDAAVTVGISHSLRSFNAELRKKQSFVPHGQCSQVYLGGHVQTGGYGQLGRSFGLLADHVEKFHIITADGEDRWVRRDDPNDKDLFFAVLGGSPGNFGVLTRVTIKVHKDSSHPKSRGLKVAYPYSRERLKSLLDVMVEMTENKDLDADFDYCVTVLSEYKATDGANTEDGIRTSSTGLNWANLEGKTQAYKPEIFDDIKKAAMCDSPQILVNDRKPTPMSQLAADWIFQNIREFNLRYVKRTYMSNSTTLKADGWTDWVSGRVDAIEGDLNSGCKLSVQIQHFGGTRSRFFTNNQEDQKRHRNTTSFSWRDTNICCVLDCFYREGYKTTAEDWQAANDQGVGLPEAKFCKDDRRVLWGSHDPNLHEVRDRYYEVKTYERLCAIKTKLDPENVFTPNGFCVGADKVVRDMLKARELLGGAEHLAVRFFSSDNGVDPPAPEYEEHVLQQVAFLLYMANDEVLAKELQESRDLQHSLFMKRGD
ncbi:hypothetical protein BGZ72_008980 [Mortierella alpina]|nr:hypothetical protein BGZ72_008980 [Mortierella alpina]